jgi:hypothetical protein
MVARCPNCRFMFEAGTPGLLPVCPQCGGPTVAIVRIAPAEDTFDDVARAPRTLKFRTEELKLAR